MFTRHGLKLNLEKTEELDIKQEGNKLTQLDSFVYLGGAVCGDGKMEREVRRRFTMELIGAANGLYYKYASSLT